MLYMYPSKLPLCSIKKSLASSFFGAEAGTDQQTKAGKFWLPPNRPQVSLNGTQDCRFVVYWNHRLRFDPSSRVACLCIFHFNTFQEWNMKEEKISIDCVWRNRQCVFIAIQSRRWWWALIIKITLIINKLDIRSEFTAVQSRSGSGGKGCRGRLS